MSNEEQTDEPVGTKSESVPPNINRNSFKCPHCGAFTHQDWYSLKADLIGDSGTPNIWDRELLDDLKADPPEGFEKHVAYLEQITARYETGNVFTEDPTENAYKSLPVQNLYLSKCYTCKKFSVWVHKKLVHPPVRTGPEPNPDLPEHITPDYEEARSVLSLSPRGAAALLRLCVEKLAIHLEAEGKTIDQRIADLVAKGLSVQVQQALDTVRVIGNEAVHPGQIDLNDDPGTAETLFRLVNIIVERMITEDRHIEELYKNLPPEKRKGIERRDKNNK